MDLQNVRRDYSLGKLSRASLYQNPIKQFEAWLNLVIEAKLPDPTAMVLGTADKSGWPNQRYVLLKNVDDNGFVFFTDTQSSKGQEIESNPKVSLLFPWHFLERQVRVQGIAQRLDPAAVRDYFHSRPIQSQQAAACSYQSQEIASRAELEQRFSEYKEMESIELPDRWGGYIVKPHSFEFWQGGENRLHDRFRYVKSDADLWTIDRLQP